MSGYLLHVAVLIMMYATLSTALDLVIGHAGMFSIAQAAFWGIGAYATAAFAVRVVSSFWLGVTTGVVIAAVMAFIVSIPTLRLNDELFLIATFGYQSVAYSIFNNWTAVTGGPMGISGIGIPVGTEETRAIAILLVCMLSCLLLFRVASSPFGRVLHVIREQPLMCAALGKNPLTFRVKAFVISACISALMGGVFATYISYIDPSSFTINDSILILTMVIVGGAGSVYGPALGAVLLTGVGEAIRFVGLPAATAANVRQLIYGVLLLLTLFIRPKGIAGKFAIVK